MGKAQSKRSVDITTEPKKCVDDEITEKVEKIEDTDHEEVSAAVKETQDKNQLKEEELSANNDKEVIVENNVDAHVGAGDSSVVSQDQNKSENDAAEDDALSSTIAEDASKKMKKEKVKKKWSFRNISFGRKDKQKPSKTEEVDDNSPTGSSNGNAADGKSLNQQKEPTGNDQLVKVEEDLEKSIGHHDENDKKIADDVISTPIITPSQTEEKLPEQQNREQQKLQKNIVNDSSLNSTNVLMENDINVSHDKIKEPEIDVTVTEIVTVNEKKADRTQSQNSHPPNKDECSDAVALTIDIDTSHVKNTSCVNGFTDNASHETSNPNNIDAAVLNDYDHDHDHDHDNNDDVRDKDINNKAIPLKSANESTTFNSDNNSYEINIEQSKPQIEVITNTSKVTANVDNLSIFSNLSKKTQDNYQDQNIIQSLQSNDETLDNKYNTVPDFVEAVIGTEQQIHNVDVEQAKENQNENDEFHSLPPPPPPPLPLSPIPTSPLPQLALSDYSIEQNIELIKNNNDVNNTIQSINGTEHDNTIHHDIQQELNNKENTDNIIVIIKDKSVFPDDHPHNDGHNNECKKEELNPIIRIDLNKSKDENENENKDNIEFNIMQAEKEEDNIEERPENTNINGNEYNNDYESVNHSTLSCKSDSNIIANIVIDELTEKAIEILDQQDAINCNKSLINNSMTTTTINDHVDHNDDIIKLATNNIGNIEFDHVTKNEYIVQINGMNNIENTEEQEQHQQEQDLIEQFEKKLCIISETENTVGEHENFVELL